MMLPIVFLAACLPFSGDGDRVRPEDLAQGEPGFAALPSDINLGFAPAPGSHRIFGVAELARLAGRYGLLLEPKAEICLERSVRPLNPADILPVMKAALALPEANIELVEYSRYPVPQGTIQFPRDALQPPQQSQRTSLWKGFVQYGGRRRFAIWARVRILVSSTRVVATTRLAPGKPIETTQLRLETHDGFPLRTPGITTLDDAIGRAPRRSLPAGTVLVAGQLDAPYEVERGDTVRVQVSRGEARLEMEARAEVSGRRGQTISVRNLSSGKRFPARVEGSGRVLVSNQP